MQHVLLRSRSWRALPGCFHGVPQPTLIGHLVVGAVNRGALARVDRVLVEAFDELGLAVPKIDGAAGLLHRVARLAEAVQCFFGHPLSSGYRFTPVRRRSDDSRAVFEAALPYHDAHSARKAVAWTVALIDSLAASDEAASPERAKESLEVLGKSLRPAGLKGINSVHLVRAAYQLGVPVARYTKEIYRYGTGHFARALESTLTDRTSLIGVGLARSKSCAAAVLAQAGLPTSQPLRVRSADEAVQQAQGIGYPVVVKPNDLDGGVGVFAHIQTEEDVREAYSKTAAATEHVLIEKHFPGNDYRLTVHDGGIVKAEQRIACSIVGDGSATVAELVEAKQASPHLRRIRREIGKNALSLDQEARGLLAAEGLAEDSVVKKRRRVALRRKNNISSGGEQLGVPLSDVHPDNAALAVRAARLLFLDIAGVDLLIGDIGKSWRDSGAVICEVNAKPQVGVRTSPGVYRDILRRLVGPNARVPAHLLIVEEPGSGDFEVATRLAHRLNCNAVSTCDGTWINGMLVGGSPPNAFTGAASVLRDTDCQAALCVVPVAEAATKGLPLDWFDSISLSERLLTKPRLMRALRPHAGSIVRASSDA